jgi:branched-chain amino acid transport system permease protein
LLDLGYAAFFALRAYTYGLAASFQLKIPWSALFVPFTWLDQSGRVRFGTGEVAQLHFSYWVMLVVAALVPLASASCSARRRCVARRLSGDRRPRLR